LSDTKTSPTTNSTADNLPLEKISPTASSCVSRIPAKRQLLELIRRIVWIRQFRKRLVSRKRRKRIARSLPIICIHITYYFQDFVYISYRDSNRSSLPSFSPFVRSARPSPYPAPFKFFENSCHSFVTQSSFLVSKIKQSKIATTFIHSPL